MHTYWGWFEENGAEIDETFQILGHPFEQSSLSSSGGKALQN